MSEGGDASAVPIRGRQRRPAVQFNTRLSPEHREKLDVLLSEHPRPRATLRDVVEDLIDDAYDRRTSG